MRWPWVSRELYERALKEARDWSDIARDATNRDDDSDRRFDALLEKYHALKLQGATALEPILSWPMPASTADPDAEFKVLIAEQAGTDLRQRGMMLRQLRQDRADGVSPEEIRQAIERGVQSDGVPT